MTVRNWETPNEIHKKPKHPVGGFAMPDNIPPRWHPDPQGPPTFTFLQLGIQNIVLQIVLKEVCKAGLGIGHLLNRVSRRCTQFDMLFFAKDVSFLKILVLRGVISGRHLQLAEQWWSPVPRAQGLNKLLILFDIMLAAENQFFGSKIEQFDETWCSRWSKNLPPFGICDSSRSGS